MISSSKFEKIDFIEETMRAYNLRVYDHHESKTAETIVGTWHTIGKPDHHDRFVSDMLKDPDIREFVY